MNWAKFGRAWALFLPLCFGLAACSTFGPLSADESKEIDFLRDDISALVFAIEAPAQLIPLPQKSMLAFHAQSNGQVRGSFNPKLVRNATADISAQLSPPASGRAYFLLQIDPQSQSALRSFQAEMLKLNDEAQGQDLDLAMSLSVAFCQTANLATPNTIFNVTAVQPNSKSSFSLEKEANLAAYLKRAGQADLPNCDGLL